LDDNPENVIAWKKTHPQGEAMLWTTDHNRRITLGSEFRVFGWDEVIDRVRQCMSLFQELQS